MQTKYIEKRLASLLDNHVKFIIVQYMVNTLSMKLIVITHVCLIKIALSTLKISSVCSPSQV